MGDNIVDKIRELKRARLPKSYFYTVGRKEDEDIKYYEGIRYVLNKGESSDITSAEKHSTISAAISTKKNYKEYNYVFKIEMIKIIENHKTYIEYSVVGEYDDEEIEMLLKQEEDAEMSAYLNKIDTLNKYEKMIKNNK